MPPKRRRAPRRRSRRRSRRARFDRVRTRGVLHVAINNQNAPVIVPLNKFMVGLDKSRASRVTRMTLTCLPVNVPGGATGVIRIGQKGEKWAFNGPQNFLELGTIIPSQVNPVTRVFRPYGPGANIFIEAAADGDFQLEFLPSGCRYTPQLGVLLTFQYEFLWQLEIPEVNDIGSQYAAPATPPILFPSVSTESLSSSLSNLQI